MICSALVSASVLKMSPMNEISYVNLAYIEKVLVQVFVDVVIDVLDQRQQSVEHSSGDIDRYSVVLDNMEQILQNSDRSLSDFPASVLLQLVRGIVI